MSHTNPAKDGGVLRAGGGANLWDGVGGGGRRREKGGGRRRRSFAGVGLGVNVGGAEEGEAEDGGMGGGERGGRGEGVVVGGGRGGGGAGDNALQEWKGTAIEYGERLL